MISVCDRFSNSAPIANWVVITFLRCQLGFLKYKNIVAVREKKDRIANALHKLLVEVS
jgi:hypothetical protein